MTVTVWVTVGPLPLPLPLLGDPLPLPGAPEAPLPGTPEIPLTGAPEAPLPGVPETPLSGAEPLGDELLDGEPLFGALGPDMRHSHAEESKGAKFIDSKQGEANSGYARVDGTQDSTQVQTPLSAGDLSLEVDSRPLNLWQRA